MKNIKILLICLVILGVGVAVTMLIFSTEPEAERVGASIETAMLVDVVTVKKGTYRPLIVATGTVQPVEDVNLSPLVSGQIIKRNPAFTPGGFVRENQVLLQIDSSDYHNTLQLRKSEFLQSQTTLDTEMGRQQIAEQDLELITSDSLFGNNPLSEEERELVLRKPQLAAVEAAISAAEASVDQARLNLERTTIRAPFDGHILTQNVTRGSLVAQGDDLGRIVGTDSYWILAAVPVSKLQWLSFPHENNGKRAPVRIENPTAWPDDAYRDGYLERQIGALDAQTRLARLLIAVPDPLAMTRALKGAPKLMIGTFVEVHIQADAIENVVQLNRDYVRTNETVWVMKNDTLEIRKVSIVLTDDVYAYIDEGLEDDEKVVITDLSAVSNGLELRTNSESSKN